MSGIAGIYNIPGNAQEMAQWSFVHAAHHTDINAAIYNALGIALPAYVLDPFNPEDPASVESWAYLHQSMHQNQNAILGIAGLDLTDVDWQDDGAKAAWVQANFSEHFQAANILQIG